MKTKIRSIKRENKRWQWKYLTFISKNNFLARWKHQRIFIIGVFTYWSSVMRVLGIFDSFTQTNLASCFSQESYKVRTHRRKKHSYLLPMLGFSYPVRQLLMIIQLYQCLSQCQQTWVARLVHIWNNVSIKGLHQSWL